MGKEIKKTEEKIADLQAAKEADIHIEKIKKTIANKQAADAKEAACSAAKDQSIKAAEAEGAVRKEEKTVTVETEKSK